MITALAFVLTLVVLILVHEYGHYSVARACGVRVLRFSLGFGRVIWRRQRSPADTEFVLSALPLGGYVRMLDEREGPVAPSELGQAFNRQPLRSRVAIVAAGPIANLLLAVLLYAASHWIGVQEPKAVLGSPVAGSLAASAGLRAGDWTRAWMDDAGEWRELRSMNDLRWQITRHALDRRTLTLEVTDPRGRSPRQVQLPLEQVESGDIDAQTLRQIGLGGAFSEPVLGRVQPDGAAAAAGLKPGDRVLTVDGLPVTDAQGLRESIRRSAAQAADGAPEGSAVPPQRWQVQRNGELVELAVAPRLARDADGLIGRIGAFVGAPAETVMVRYGVVEGLADGVERTWDMSVLTVRMIGRMLIGEASVKNLSGPLTIADFAGQSAERGLAYYLGFLALVSVSLGVLNLLPLPMLDGGHLMYYLFEGLTGRPVSDLWLARLQRGGIAVLLLMMSVALFNDVARFLGLH